MVKLRALQTMTEIPVKAIKKPVYVPVIKDKEIDQRLQKLQKIRKNWIGKKNYSDLKKNYSNLLQHIVENEEQLTAINLKTVPSRGKLLGSYCLVALLNSGSLSWIEKFVQYMRKKGIKLPNQNYETIQTFCSDAKINDFLKSFEIEENEE